MATQTYKISGTITVETADPPVPPVPPSPPPVPPVPPVPPPTPAVSGGWRIANPFCRGSIAIDWSTRRLWMGGHTQQGNIQEYVLPDLGTGDDPSAWPAVKPTQTIAAFWPGGSSMYPNDMVFWNGDLWVSPKFYYDTSPPNDHTWYSLGGKTLNFANLPRQRFSGFMKRFKLDPMPGGGGYESGQGFAVGPCLATVDGKVVLDFPQQPGDWDHREHREPDYYPSGHTDSWLALDPAQHGGEGRWACDKIYGGGLQIGDKYCFWPQLGTGSIDYALQNATFSNAPVTRLYQYDLTGKLLGWTNTPYGSILGHDFGPNGETVLCEGNVWKSELYQVDPVIRVLA